MHVPDNYLSPQVCVATGAAAVAMTAYAVRRVNRSLSPEDVPLMGVTAAFLFAAQMVNFHVPGGTSGHLLGGVLAAVLLGPDAAMLVMVTVLTAQCFLFQDGGVTALGANVLNMGITGTYGGYLVYRTLDAVLRRRWPVLPAAALAAWFAVVAGAALCALELAWSGTAATKLVVPAMVGWHLLIGVGEALATWAALSAVRASRPDLLPARRTAQAVSAS